MNETPVPAVLDQAAFQQVWRRVMPEDRPDCPFTLNSPAVPAMAPPPHPIPPRQAPSPGPAPVCLGQASAGELPILVQLLDQTVDGYRIYRSLARRTREALPPSLAAVKHQQARRLSAAHFLISGKRHSSPPTPAPQFHSLALSLRSRYQAEQQSALALFSAANTSSDPCLIDLYRSLAAENQSLAGQLRLWIERH